MHYRLFKLRFRRRLKHGQKQVEDIGLQAEAGLERHFFRRLNSLGKAWRFIASWVLLLVLLIGGSIVQLEGLSRHFQTVQPIAGGTYSEGVLGVFTNANPIYATSEVDTTVSHLVFAGLFTYDNQNRLVGDLARGYDANDKGTIYTVHLKPGLTWQDGVRLTADDVVFTYHAIQNPDAQSPLAASWQGITVTKKDAYTVVFTLPNPLASFPYTLTTGIVPAHAFASLSPTAWRSADFNSLHPIGAGPFAWSALQVERAKTSTARILIALKPFKQYINGAPKLDGFVVHAFSDKNDMLRTFQSQQLSAITVPSLTDKLAADKAVHQYSFVLTAANMAFFNTTSTALADAQVRRALVQGTNVAAIQSKLGYPTRSVREPLLNGQVGYDPAYAQAAYDVKAAKGVLDKAGWVVGKQGVRSKDGKQLKISLAANSSDEHTVVTKALKYYWEILGAKVDIELQDDQSFQTTLANHDYDAVLYGISIGVDPDVYVYWDSSQTDPRSTRLNLSLYKSAAADAALEAGRTRFDPALRTIKYRPFLQAWQQDAPALALYQPRYLYLTRQNVYGLDVQVINNGVDRFNNVQNWMIRTASVTNE